MILLVMLRIWKTYYQQWSGSQSNWLAGNSSNAGSWKGRWCWDNLRGSWMAPRFTSRRSSIDGQISERKIIRTWVVLNFQNAPPVITIFYGLWVLCHEFTKVLCLQKSMRNNDSSRTETTSRSLDYAICAGIRLAAFVYGHRIGLLRIARISCIELQDGYGSRTDADEMKVTV